MANSLPSRRGWAVTLDSEGQPRAVTEMPDARAEQNGWSTVSVVPASELDRYREALEFYAEQDSEPEAGGVDGGQTALTALGFSAGCPRCGGLSADPPAEVYCARCATEDTDA